MTQPSNFTDEANAWLTRFEDALADRDEVRLRDAFYQPEAYWRDLLSFTWDTTQFHGVDSIVEEMLTQTANGVAATAFALDPERKPPSEMVLIDLTTIEFFFTFRTPTGRSRGHVYAVPTPDGLRAHVLQTYLVELDAAHPRTLTQRHPGLGFEPEWPGQTWSEFRERQTSYADRDPDVLIVGGSQAGASVAAQLAHLDVDALIVDKHERPGDGWRKRYASLALHTPTDMSDFPFFPFPKSFAHYLPKDKFADYIEAYIRLMDLNYWTSTTFLGATFSEETLRWEAHLERDGEMRQIHPKHIIVCIGGAGGTPFIPQLPGLESFEGEVVHSADFGAGADFTGKRALVVGTGTSAHDIALDLYHNGAEVEMMQRGSISVANIETANAAYADFTNPAVPQVEADVRSNTRFILPLLTKSLKKYTVWANEADRELHQGLTAAGLRLDNGEDDTGWLIKFWRYSGGYYLNVGASDAIISGGIKVTQFDDFDTFTPHGVRRRDGSERELDLVVLATGYENISTSVRSFFGDEVADRVGAIGGIGESGERRNHAAPTAQPHLWFVYGGIIEGRRSAPSLALSIKANLEGVVPTLVRGADGRLEPLAAPTTAVRSRRSHSRPS